MFNTEDMQKVVCFLGSQCPYAFQLIWEMIGHLPFLQTGTWRQKKVLLCLLVNKWESGNAIHSINFPYRKKLPFAVRNIITENSDTIYS